jgi:hypothetical protein
LRQAAPVTAVVEATAARSEWTPWIAIAAVILFFGAIGLLIFGVIEAASHLVASASS